MITAYTDVSRRGVSFGCFSAIREALPGHLFICSFTQVFLLQLYCIYQIRLGTGPVAHICLMRYGLLLRTTIPPEETENNSKQNVHLLSTVGYIIGGGTDSIVVAHSSSCSPPTTHIQKIHQSVKRTFLSEDKQRLSDSIRYYVCVHLSQRYCSGTSLTRGKTVHLSECAEHEILYKNSVFSKKPYQRRLQNSCRVPNILLH